MYYYTKADVCHESRHIYVHMHTCCLDLTVTIIIVSYTLLENEEAKGQTDDGWTIVQAKSTTRNTNKSESVVGANVGNWQQVKMMPAVANKYVNASMTYADSVRGNRSGIDAIEVVSSCRCSCQKRGCNDRNKSKV